MRIALGLEYDGAPFRGWQTQPGGHAVQDHVEAALARFAGAPIATLVAGRTDAGVHATGQVVHFDTESIRDPVSWVRGPNTYLDPRIRITWAKVVPPDFHARFGATDRTYRYYLLDDAVAPGVLAGRIGWFHRPLDEAAMARAAARVIGEHDFSAFRDAQCQAKSPVRTMHEASVVRRGPVVVFTFRANAFLHHMVRNLVGSLVYVGAGRQSDDWTERLLVARDRRLSAPTFAPDGLYLEAVAYDPSLGLPPPRANLLAPLR
ncbi:MAG TPA: tRNA pseudouridine(38-40) synthase TruA [Usitatibacteraceae bacterium]|nr:tRNA pseudouridine(38-40) synthase TruA [Usitatibacteraceae bacterium]